MARSVIFLTEFVERKTIKKDCWYSYFDEYGMNILQVYKGHELVYEREAKLGAAFEVIDRGKNPFVTPMVPPRGNGNIIGWLLGFSKRERAASCEEYRSLLNQKYTDHSLVRGVEHTISAVRFEFAKYVLLDEEDSSTHNLACWVDENITKKEILHLVPMFVYPKYYVKKVLKEKFDISDEEVEEALSSRSKL